ncbi:MAG: hypothetical protein DRG87_06055 [Deltaproteobacteria bacterium]|nr:MAG: hypothetical protein DRG87_06055 [Deltaproteobacteria bacterium]
MLLFISGGFKGRSNVKNRTKKANIVYMKVIKKARRISCLSFSLKLAKRAYVRCYFTARSLRQ